jgi:hypothetical protein
MGTSSAATAAVSAMADPDNEAMTTQAKMAT